MKNLFTLKNRRGGCLFSIFKLILLLVIIVAVAVYFFITPIANTTLSFLLAGSGVDANIGSIKMNLTEQEVDVHDFYITNPPAYSKGNAIAFSQAYIKTDINPIHVFSKKLITVDEIKVVGLDADVELSTAAGLAVLFTSPKSNLTDLVNIIVPQSANNQQQVQKQTTTTAESEPFKIIIKKIVFEDGKAKCGINKNVFEAKLPSFVIENLGTSQGGLTPSELVAQILGKLSIKITGDVIKQAAKEGIKLGDDAGSGAVNATSDSSKKLKNVIKSLF